jgi:hypothetical protein
MGANPLHFDVEGSPYRIGERIIIKGSEDETFDPVYLGRTGIVKYLEYGCGCGQSYPLDPMIGVEFDNGTTAEFWREELSRCHPSHRKSPATFNATDKRHDQENQVSQGREEPGVAGVFCRAREDSWGGVSEACRHDHKRHAK